MNAATTPPIQLDEHVEVHEDLRLSYRYIDLRRDVMQDRMRLRHQNNLSASLSRQPWFLGDRNPDADQGDTGRCA